MYSQIIRPLLFALSPERAHNISFKALELICRIPGAAAIIRRRHSLNHPALQRDLFGVTFRNPVGISAGVDCDGKYYNQLGLFGAGFVEIGTLTNAPQEGNAKPRWYRLKGRRAFVNNLGHANKGVRSAISNIQKNPPKDIVVIASIAKNSETPSEKAVEDIDRCYTLIYDFSDIVVINMLDTDIGRINEIIDRVTSIRRFNDEHHPILVKIPPDMSHEEMDAAVHAVLSYGIDGLVVSGSTYSTDAIEFNMEHGELSGAPVFEHSLETLKYVLGKSKGLIPVIISGGIMTPEQALTMLDNGASLIELHTGLAFEGPMLIKRILKHLVATDRERHPEKYTKHGKLKK